jgi:hypothetical protein
MFGPHENWQRILSVDLWGVINGSQELPCPQNRSGSRRRFV